MTLPGIPAPAILIATGRSRMYSSGSATGYGAPSRKSNLQKCGTTDAANPIRSSSGQCDAMSSDTLGSGAAANHIRFHVGRRHSIEDCFAKIKEFRGIATRYDRTDTSYAANRNLTAMLIEAR